MSAFKTDSFGDRIRNAASARKAELEKFRTKTEVDEKVVAEREAARREIVAAREARALERKAEQLPRRRQPLTYAVCARGEVTDAPAGTLVVTARDIFGD